MSWLHLTQKEIKLIFLPLKKKRKNKSSLNFDVHSELYRLTGVDLTSIDGMNENSVLKVLAETGTDMSH